MTSHWCRPIILNRNIYPNPFSISSTFKILDIEVLPKLMSLSNETKLVNAINSWGIASNLLLGSTKLTTNLVRLLKHFLDTRIISFRKKFILVVTKNRAVDGEIKRSAKIIFWFLSKFSSTSMFNVDLSFNRKSKSP